MRGVVQLGARRTERFTRLGTPVVNSNHDYLSAFYKFYAASDGQPYAVGASSWPDAVLRVYRGVSGVDASGYAGTGSAGTSLSLPTLAATSAAGDEYIGCFANDTRAIILPSDLGHATTQASQWQLGDGDKLDRERRHGGTYRDRDEL